MKENDSDESSEEVEEGPALPGGKNYITPGGHRRLRDELQHLLNGERPEVVRVVSWAASNGDRSENGDYLYGKKRLREIDRRIRFLTKRLEIATVVDPTLQKGTKKVLFGATVTVEDEEGKRRTFSIVGVDETDASRGRVSWISPIGKALLQADEGQVVTLRTPKGDEELEVIKVTYAAID